jgi:hypothetical protein
MREDSRNEFFGDFFEKSLELKNKKLNYQYWGSKFRRANLFNVPTVNKGIVFFGNGFEGNTILEAISQAVFGATKAHYDYVSIVCDMVGDTDNILNAVLSLPIVVTTADIFKIKKNTSLEEIETSNLMQLVEKTPGVLYYHTDYSILKPFRDSLNEEYPITLESEQEQFLTKDASKNVASYIHPGYVYIINYYNLTECFTTCINYIQNIIEDIKKHIV